MTANAREPNSLPTRSRLPLAIAGGVAVVLAAGGFMMHRAESRTDHLALASLPKGVTVVKAEAASYRPTRTYVGTLEPWVEASIGPQLVSAYLDTVLVRPGAIVKKGEVLATLDCRQASAATKAIASRARALDFRQQAIEHESTRTQGLLQGGFVSPNEAEQKNAESVSQAAQVEAERANLAKSSLEVGDCVLRAPFAGEIATRTADPGAFVHPGDTVVTVVDRDVVRMVADAPETDVDVIPAGTKVTVHVYASGRDLAALVTRRAPAADPATRTVHFEVDLPDPDRAIPVGTTGEVRVAVGQPVPAVKVPLIAATVRGAKADLFVVSEKTAHLRTIAVLGEAGGALYLDPALPAGSAVVVEGRALLEDGDRVAAREPAVALERR